MILTIARKEFRSLFASPSTWLMLGGLQFIFAWYFLVLLDSFLHVQADLTKYANAPGATQMVVTPLYGSLALILMMLVPIFTMRLLAEERRSQTLALLLTAPVSDTQIVLGKFFGLMLFLLTIEVSCTAMVLALALGTPIDYGLVLTNFAGLLLFSACLAATGLYLSSLTTQPLVAAIGASAILFGLWLLDMSTTDRNQSVRALTPSGHFQHLNAGLLDSSDLVYFALFSTLFLTMTVRRIHNNRIYG